MRYLLLFLSVLLFTGKICHAQKTDRKYIPYAESMIRKDTIRVGSFAVPFMDSTVVSFEISVWAIMPDLHPIYINRIVKGNSLSAELFLVLSQLMPGSKVYYDNIIISTGTNRTIRAQDRLYYVK